jgi:hypothetical protein
MINPIGGFFVFRGTAGCARDGRFERPVVDRPVPGRLGVDRPVAGRLGPDRPVAGRFGVARPVGGRPAGGFGRP